MKAIVVTDEAAGTAGMTLMERPEPQAAINDVVVQVHASGFTPGELTWPGTWTDRLGRDRTPSIPGHEVAGVVSALGYGTRGLSVGQRVFGLADWTRDGTLAEYVVVEARSLAALPGDVDFTVSCPTAPNSVRSPVGCGTDGCGRTSAQSRPSTTPSLLSTPQSGSRARRSSAFVRERPYETSRLSSM